MVSPPKLERNLLPHIAETLKGLGHPHRLRVLEALAERERSVGNLAEEFALPQAVVSQHLKVMRSAGIVRSRREGTFTYYSLAFPGLRNLLQCLATCQSHCVPRSPAEVPKKR